MKNMNTAEAIINEINEKLQNATPEMLLLIRAILKDAAERKED